MPSPATAPVRAGRSVRRLRTPPPVGARTVLAALRPRPTQPILGRLGDEEAFLLRVVELDERILVTVMGGRVPRDLVATPCGRAVALVDYVPPYAVLTDDGALWVHAGGPAPRHLTVNLPGRVGVRPDVSVRRGRLPRWDVVTIAGMRCTSLERTAVDLARTAPPVQAVQAVLTARAHGATRQSLCLALQHCRGACAVGRPRAQRIIDALMPPGAQ
ncbi:hypothetical protein [Actinomyces sp. oral taxon 414]|uniref:hypothetical protein n=1 Tax=Actinomyces sp. oral taxon 414 TaxID=712122 RepID=UPI000A4C0377|nr:hypothetical protein [Actinomyces sp. oral taxon 414]